MNAGFFRKLSRNENPSATEAQPALLFLLLLLGFEKTEDDCWEFLADCLNWFRDKKGTFEVSEDNEILRLVRNRFKAYILDRAKALQSKEGQPWRTEQLGDSGEDKGITIDYKRLKRESKVALEQSRKETLKAGRWLRRLQRKHPWLAEYFHRRLKQEVEYQHNPKLRQKVEQRLADRAVRSIASKNSSK